MKLKLALLHRSHEEISARQLSWPSFYEHFSPGLSAFLDRCIERALSLQLEHAAGSLSEELTLCAVRDIVTVDSTLIALNDGLAEEFPNARSTHCPAAAKLNLRFSVPSRELDAFRIAPDKASESSLLEIGDWVSGRLVLYDLGYFKIDDFVGIDERGGFFVSRLKRNADPLLLASLNSGRGNRIDLKDRRLRETEPYLKRRILDARGVFVPKNLSGKRMEELHRNPEAFHPLRIVGIRDEEDGEYHLYVTNLPEDRIPPERVARLYRVRWAIEILFKVIKGTYGLNAIASGRAEIVGILIRVALLTQIVSGKVHQILEEARGRENGHRMGPILFEEFFARHAVEMLHALFRHQNIAYDPFGPLHGNFIVQPHESNPERERLEDIYTKPKYRLKNIKSQ